ncbi:atypical/PDHK/BCKDK protein kinase [Vararia minispora EC-137]|uniref:Atypical/PDHK/BCKDK protein kinase n=1 Tax=Vararia minispora EC-137 TaxID=1314806 RepID=A0ACB8Q6T2_9AGAM|nr:atypical/PDHK/BCKDK protein kinase [Vararia minispora EC-137]
MLSRRPVHCFRPWSRKFISSYLCRTPEPASPELAQLLATHAQHAPQPLTLGSLLSLGRPLTSESILASAQIVQTEMPRRLAMRIRSLEGLPFIVGTNPHIARILEGFRKNFLWSASYPPITNIEENSVFTSQLENLVRDHANDIPTIAKGFQECQRYMSAEAISSFLDAAIRNRIAVRLIAEQHVALTHALNNPDGLQDHLGVIDMNLSPVKMLKMCASFVAELCEASLGASPSLIIDGHTEARFAYVPVHLEYVVTELLKNAFRATVERHHSGSSTSLPPVQVTVSLPSAPPSMSGLAQITSPTRPRMLHIRIRDRGGGVAPVHIPHIFAYSFTTAGRNAVHALADEDELDGPYAAQHVGGGAAVGSDLFGEIAGKGVQTGMGTIAGLGFGLPMSRLYAQYFGGSLELFSLDGWGCDVLLKLRCLDHAEDAEI